MTHFICKIKGHHFVRMHTKNIIIKKYECSVCKEQFTRDGYDRMVKFTEYWKKNHQLFEKYYKKRVIS